MEDENAKLKQYLLGSLAPPETEAIDLQLIADEGLEEKLCWAESELAEDYLDETLSPAEVALFQKNFLASPERAAQIRQISLLRNYARSSAVTGAAADEVCEKSPEATFYERLKRFFSLDLRPATAVFALVIVGLIIGAIVYRSAYQPTALEKEFAELNRKDLSNLSQYENLTKLDLSFGAFRDSGGAGRLPESGLTESVLFRLALPSDANSADKFTIEIIKDKKIILSLSGTPFYNNSSGKELRLLVPSSVLKRGEYQIKVERETANESAVIYNFTVQ